MIKETTKPTSIPAGNSNKLSWKVSSKVGGKFPNIRPLFTKDNEHVVIVTSLHIKIFSLSTKTCIHSYSLDSSEITDIAEDVNGNLFVSKFNEPSLTLDQTGVNATSIKLPILKILKMTQNFLYCILENSGKLELSEIDLNDDNTVRIIRSDKSAKLVAISSSFRYFAVYSAKHEKYHITVIELDENWNLVAEKLISRARPILSLAISDAGLLAAGSETGVIDLYYGDENTLRSLKWHVDSVTSLEFSLDGTYLLSGGKERVLVFWQMETGNTQFLPRLDGTIDSIFVSPASQLYGLILSGEQVLILSAVDLESRLLVAGVKPHFAKEFNEREQKRRKKKFLLQSQQQMNLNDLVGRAADYTCPYYIHPVTKNAYFPTRNRAQIQIYNPVKDEQQQVISVASAIQTGKVKSETMIEDPTVTQLCFSNDGKWMVTADSRQNPSVEALMSKDDVDINLKFWRLDEGGWNLCTRVSSPHGRNKQMADVISTSNGGFITAAEDGSVRYWGLSEGSKRFTGNKGMDKWSVRKLLSTSSRTSSAVTLTISDDSSVIALGFENNVYIIDAKKFEIRSSLSNVAGSRIRAVKILKDCLVMLSKTRLVVWNLLTNTEKWTVGIQSPANGRRLIDFDPATETFCFAYNFYGRDYRIQSKLFFMGLDSPLPIQIESHNTAVSSLRLIPGAGSNFSFVDIKGRINILSCNYDKSVQKPATDFKQHVLALYSNTVGSAVSNKVSDHANGTVTQNNILTVASLEPVFENSDLGLEAMFESLLDIVSPAV